MHGQENFVREEDSETNNRVIDTVVRPNKEVSIIVILMNRLIVSFIIRALNNENPLSCHQVCVACIFEKKKTILCLFLYKRGITKILVMYSQLQTRNRYERRRFQFHFMWYCFILSASNVVRDGAYNCKVHNFLLVPLSVWRMF